MSSPRRSHGTPPVSVVALGTAAVLLGTPVSALAGTTAAEAPAQVQAASDARSASGWSREGGSWRFYREDGSMATGWVVTDTLPGDSAPTGLQRYWFDSNGNLVVDELVQTGEDTWAYARPEGYVVRGKWYDIRDGNVYIADNDGLLAGPGWVVSDSYGDSLQRYWIDAETHSCVPGISEDGWAHLTTKDGYVLRGKYVDPETGYVYLADNDGLLAGPGWVVSDSYGDGLQRYRVSESYACVPGFSSDGWAHYTTDAGYVLRGTYQTGDGALIADNDGRLLEDGVDLAAVDANGWFVGDLGSGLQRYCFNVVDGHLYSRTGLFAGTIGETRSSFYADPSQGYVVRNATVASPLVVDGKSYTSDNEGRLTLIEDASEPEEPVVPDTGTPGGDAPSEDVEYPPLGGQRTRDPYVATVTWAGDTAYIDRLAEVASNIGSDTNYFMTFDNQLCRVIVFQRSASGSWEPIRLWNCMGARKTYSAANQHLYGWGGVYKITDHQICSWDDSYFGTGMNDWASCFIEYYDSYNATGHSRYIEGKGWENCVSFHATGDVVTGNNNTGCCGLLYDNAKWVYDNIPLYTTVIEFDYSDGTYF